MPGMVNRPSARETAEYVVPDGRCTATTRAPSTGVPAESVAMPAMAEVVTPWASAEPTTNIVKTAAATRARPEPTIQRMDGPLLRGNGCRVLVTIETGEKVARPREPVKDARWVLYEADTRLRRQREYSASTPPASAARRLRRRRLWPAETSAAR